MKRERKILETKYKISYLESSEKFSTRINWRVGGAGQIVKIP